MQSDEGIAKPEKGYKARKRVCTVHACDLSTGKAALCCVLPDLKNHTEGKLAPKVVNAQPFDDAKLLQNLS